MRKRFAFPIVLSFAAACLVAALFVESAGARTDRSLLYTWPGSVLFHVYSQPEGAGWIRSDPYALDCPSECTRAFDPGTTLMLTAHPTPGFKFARWTGPCAGQSNPCTVQITPGIAEVSAIWAGEYTP